ncbi:MAG TPA: hypothetical protein VNN73_10635 [Blastocatellia bacterium]|nr:hypothetical protein [Blastocatellia bacterium]
MAKGKKKEETKPAETGGELTAQDVLISGAARAVGSVVGAVAAATDFVSTQVTGEPLFAEKKKSPRPKKKSVAKKARTSKAIAKKTSGTKKAAKSKASAKKTAARKASSKKTAKKAAKKRSAKKR